MAEKPIKLKLFTSQHEIYIQTLMSLREKIGWIAEMEVVDQAFVLPYVLTCAAALECALNDYILKHLEDKKKSKAVVSGYLSMNLK